MRIAVLVVAAALLAFVLYDHTGKMSASELEKRLQNAPGAYGARFSCVTDPAGRWDYVCTDEQRPNVRFEYDVNRTGITKAGVPGIPGS